MIYQAIGIGIVVSFAFYEIVGLSPGGIVVPGYIALFLDQPIRILVTLLIALLTYFIISKLSNYVILYGRRRFLAMILIGFLLKWLVEEIIITMPISCLLYTSDAADEEDSVDLGGRRIIKKKKKKKYKVYV